ncbi:MAG TPA: MaoC/PaaZ C-terminal domain-containing protein [Candidatus Tumulicola sp.]|jgi:acyl dehydratase
MEPIQPRRYLEDFDLGETFETPAYTLCEQDARAFALSYDPQPFHLDAGAAAESLFGELVVSGWHTAAITMRLIVECGVLRDVGIVGTGIDELRWLAPVGSASTLFVRGTIFERVPRPGRSRGILRVKLLTIDQSGATVMTQIANLIVPQRTQTPEST